jgi:hypothetical protein
VILVFDDSVIDIKIVLAALDGVIMRWALSLSILVFPAVNHRAIITIATNAASTHIQTHGI